VLIPSQMNSVALDEPPNTFVTNQRRNPDAAVQCPFLSHSRLMSPALAFHLTDGSVLHFEDEAVLYEDATHPSRITLAPGQKGSS